MMAWRVTNMRLLPFSQLGSLFDHCSHHHDDKYEGRDVSLQLWLLCCCRAARIVAALQPGCEEMEREWGNEEEMERKWGNGERLTLYISSFSLYFLPLSPFPPSLSISYIKMHHILLQNVKYGTFVANVTKISTYALWGNNSGSNLLRGSSAICAGLCPVTFSFWRIKCFEVLTFCSSPDAVLWKKLQFTGTDNWYFNQKLI